MKLHTLKPSAGSGKDNTRVGRGQGSGKGGTSARGHKGAKSRSGYKSKAGFEGGQMPLHRRMPKFGFNNPFRTEYTILNLSRIQEIVEAHPGTEINKEFLLANKLIARKTLPIKILGEGELKASVKITADKFSKSAAAAIEKAGGQAITVA